MFRRNKKLFFFAQKEKRIKFPLLIIQFAKILKPIKNRLLNLSRLYIIYRYYLLRQG